MATVTGLTAARMLAIEAASVISGAIVGNDLILTKFDASTINAGNVRGPQGPTGPDGNPIGTIIMGGWSAEPANYKFLNGQTLVGGVAAYPTIAALFPSWVSSANLILPNMAGAVPMGSAGAAGLMSGAMTHTLVEANLASHVHSGPSHTHTGPSHTHTGPAHQHTFTTGVNSIDHFHTYSNAAGTGGGGLAGGSTYAGQIYNTSGQNTTHTHSGTTDAEGTGLTGSSGTGNTGASGTANTGAAGSGTPVDHTPRNISVKFAIKVL
jgi:hypothetical protein